MRTAKKPTLIKEIAEVIRELQKLAIHWEKQFPENPGKSSWIKARTPRRRLAQFLTPPPLVAASGIDNMNRLEYASAHK